MTCDRRFLHTALLLFAGVGGTSVATAQDPARSLRGRVGVDAAATLTASQFVDDRLRGLERLGSAGTPRAVARLMRAIEPGGSATTAEERLTAVRVLSAFTDDVTVRRALARVVGGHATPSSAEAPTALDALAEQTAALALARSGVPDALATLGKALVTPGRAAVASHLALVAHPPRDLESVLHAATASSLELATTLDDLGDPRARGALRQLVLSGKADVRAVAAVALSRIGEPEVVPLAHQWLEPKSPTVLRVAAVRILTVAHDKGATTAIAALLAGDETRADGIAFALIAPDPALVSPLVRTLANIPAEQARDVLTAIGRAGGGAAAQWLASRLSDPTFAVTAADALARMPGKDAAEVLEAALGVHATERLAARAGTVRWLVLGEKLRGLDATLGALTRSKDRTDRAVGLSASVALDRGRFENLLRSPTRDDDLESVMPLLLLAPEDVATRVAAHIESVGSNDVRTALALALVVPKAEHEVPTAVLLSLVDAGSAASPLAARTLAERDEPRLRPAIVTLLGSPVATLRAHTALGLGRSSTPDATGLLEAAYRFETVPEVRKAITRALAMRPGRGNRTLTLARDLDPDAGVRRAARAARGGRKWEFAGGKEVVWVTMTDGRPIAAPTAATLMTPEGLFLPVELGPDGQALAAGLPEGSRVLRVAPARPTDDDSIRGAIGHEKNEHSEGGRRSP